jgi:hypothetical protein
VTLLGVGDGDDPASATILDANHSGRVVLVNGGVTATLQGLRITGGAENGGGIENFGTLTVTGCTITGNIAPFQGSVGGGVRNQRGATLTMTDCVVTDNHADNAGSGGGIFNIGGTLTLSSGASVRGNSAPEGGGIFNSGGTVTFNAGSLVCDNSAPQCTGFSPPAGFCGVCP